MYGLCPRSSGGSGRRAGPRGPDEPLVGQAGTGRSQGPWVNEQHVCARAPASCAPRACPEDWRSATAEFGSFPRVTAVVGGGSLPRSNGLGVGVCQTQPGGRGGTRGWYVARFGGSSRGGSCCVDREMPRGGH